MSMTEVKNDFIKWIAQILNPSNKQGAIARMYPLYQQLQLQRFMTENESEGAQWLPLNDAYKKYKLKRYGGGSKRPTKANPATQWKTWPGNGSKMLIGTGTLAGAVIGPGNENPFDQSGIAAHQVLFTNTSMTVTINNSGQNAEGHPFVYASYVNEKRPFMKFSDDHIAQMKTTIESYYSPGGTQ